MHRLSTYPVVMATQPIAMRKPTYLVLASLLDGPLHGTGIIERAVEISGGRVRLTTGTVFTALDRLTNEGYVRLVSEETSRGRLRRTYGLTRAVLAPLPAEASRREAPFVAGRRARAGHIVVVGGRMRAGS
jgi:PadR family transcriptional regulator, regulatory protein PadR